MRQCLPITAVSWGPSPRPGCLHFCSAPFLQYVTACVILRVQSCMWKRFIGDTTAALLDAPLPNPTCHRLKHACVQAVSVREDGAPDRNRAGHRRFYYAAKLELSFFSIMLCIVFNTSFPPLSPSSLCLPIARSLNNPPLSFLLALSPSLLSVLQPTLLPALMVHAIRKPISGRGGGEGGLSLSSEATLVPPAEAHSRMSLHA